MLFTRTSCGEELEQSNGRKNKRIFSPYSTWKNETDNERNFRCFDFGKRETEGNAGRLDDGNWNRNEPIHSGFLPILDFGFGIPRIRNGEMERQTKRLWELWTKLRTGLCLCERNAGTNSRTGLWVEGNKGKEKTKEKGKEKHFEGSAVFGRMEFNISKGSAVFGRMEFNISKVQTVLERMEFNISKVFTGFYFGTGHLIHE
ncbi:unnamed protein product [Rhizophagus irregularis]|nr:unnamed protein product [Rhizophagus irregularis]CAB4437284.1 unnamed protein product [Rhizophagus irregularis]